MIDGRLTTSPLLGSGRRPPGKTAASAKLQNHFLFLVYSIVGTY